MNMLICPLCGKSTSLRNFDPSNFDDDIYVQTVRGLGRGRSFKVVDRESILGDNDATRSIGKRVLDIILLLLHHDILSANQFYHH